MDYSRQPIFSQEKLKSGRVVIAGAGPIANYLCAYLSGLGVGNITLIDDGNGCGSSNEFMRLLSGKNGSRKHALKDAMLKMNDEINIEADIDLLSGSSIIVDLTNDPASKKRHRELSDELNLMGRADIRLVLSASSDFDAGSTAAYRPARRQSPAERALNPRRGASKDNIVSGLLGRINEDPFLMERYKGKEQGSFSSAIQAALCADEIRKTISPLDTDYPIQRAVHFDLSSDERFCAEKPAAEKKPGSDIELGVLKTKKVLVVGAGGTGTYTALNLALLGFGRIDIYDGDFVEDHNRNRQVLFYGKVGQPKASSLAERLSKINPSIKIRGHDKFVDGEILADEIGKMGYDIIFSCVDIWRPRRMLNRFAVESKTPMFDCSVSLFDGYTHYFIPGKNRCYECRFDFDSLVQSETQRRINHCSPSVIVPNAVVGAINAAEAVALMFPERYSMDYGKFIKFDDISYDAGKLSLKQSNYREKCAAGCSSPAEESHEFG